MKSTVKKIKFTVTLKIKNTSPPNITEKDFRDRERQTINKIMETKEFLRSLGCDIKDA